MSDARDTATQSMGSHCTTDKPEEPLPHSHKRTAARSPRNQVELKAYHAAAPTGLKMVCADAR